METTAGGDVGRDRATVLALSQLAAQISSLRSRALAPYGLDEAQFDVLETLVATEPPYRLTAGELARRCRVTRGAVSQRLAGMERSGLVERVREQPDRRTVHVRLTEAGRLRLEAAVDDVATADRALLEALSGSDRKALDAILRRWLGAQAKL